MPRRARFGEFLSDHPGLDTPTIPERGISASQMTHLHDTSQDTEKLFNSITDGTIQAVIEAEYPFNEALSALEKTETRHARGKLVVTIQKESL